MKRILGITAIFLLTSVISGYAYSIVEGLPLWAQTELSYSVVNNDPHEMVAPYYSDNFLGYVDSNVYSGYYLGTIVDITSGDEEFVKAVHDYCLAWSGECIDFDEKYIYKAEDENDWNDGTLSVVFDNVTDEDDYGKSGTWEFSDSSQGFGFYAVKAGKEMALYFVSPTASSGKWNTLHVLNPAGNIPSISHLSGIDPPVPAVPEPGTILLFGSGLLGLGFALRNRKRIR